MKRILLIGLIITTLSMVSLVNGCQPLSEPSEEIIPAAIQEIAAEETSLEPLEEGPYLEHLAPDFELKDLEGKSISLSELQGNTVMINFWASWCGPCRYEMPFIQEVYDEWSDQGLTVLAVNVLESTSTVKSFIQAEGYSFPVLLDTQGVVALEYNIVPIPTTFFIDKDGIIQTIQLGAFRDVDEIELILNKIIE